VISKSGLAAAGAFSCAAVTTNAKNTMINSEIKMKYKELRRMALSLRRSRFFWEPALGGICPILFPALAGNKMF
jgi:hypothetical protein